MHNKWIKEIAAIGTLHPTIQFDDPIFICWIKFHLSIAVLNGNEFSLFFCM